MFVVAVVISHYYDELAAKRACGFSPEIEEWALAGETARIRANIEHLERYPSQSQSAKV